MCGFSCQPTKRKTRKQAGSTQKSEGKTPAILAGQALLVLVASSIDTTNPGRTGPLLLLVVTSQ